RAARPRVGRAHGRARVQVVAPRALHAALALRGGRVAASRADDLARLPAARGVALGRRRAHGRAPGVVADLLEAPVLLGVAVSGIHLDQRLPIGIVLARGELLVPGRAGGRVEAPRVAVRDDDRVETPLPELLDQLPRRERHLAAVLRQLAGVDTGGTGRYGGELVLELTEVEVALAVRPVEDGKAQPLPERRTLAQRADQVTVEGADRPLRDLIVG